MYLSDNEHHALEGRYGEALSLAMRILVKLGKAYGADSLVPIASAHLVACSYQIAGEAGIDMYSRLLSAGAQVRVPTTLDPASIDFARWESFRTPRDYAERQVAIAGLLEQMGVIPTWTCTPYYVLNVPRYGEHLGWSESSAVVFANSVIGARTNRLAAYVDLCAALTGKAPHFGLHVTQNRRGQVLFDLSDDLTQAFRDEDFPVLGYMIGGLVADRVPVIQGLSHATFDQLKALGAGAASSGSVALYHIVGITPEARDLADAFQGDVPDEVIHVGLDEMDATRRTMSTFSEGVVDVVALGCPHASIDQIRRYVDMLSGRNVHPGTELWVCMNSTVESMAREMGHLETLEAAGARVMVGTCLNDCPLEAWRFRHLVTDSAKFAYYTPTTIGCDCCFASTEHCIDAAVQGRL